MVFSQGVDAEVDSLDEGACEADCWYWPNHPCSYTTGNGTNFAGDVCFLDVSTCSVWEVCCASMLGEGAHALAPSVPASCKKWDA